MVVDYTSVFCPLIGRTVRFAREDRIGERFAEGWQVMYDEDGRYFRTSGPATSQVLIADGP